MADKPELLDHGIRYKGWEITTAKGHIMISRCHSGGCADETSACDYCRFNNAFRFNMPDELYAGNSLTIRHVAQDAQIKFIAFDALKGVDPVHDRVKVAYADEWLQSRKHVSSRVKDVVKPFDWTFSTNYSGSVSDKLKVSPTDERIDIEALKVPEPILYHEYVHLLGDDYSDNGSMTLYVRVRVMPSGFFVLLRQFIRIDRVLIRVNDTRLYHRFEWQYLLREFTSRERSVPELAQELKIDHDDRMALIHLYKEETLPSIIDRLKITQEAYEKIEFV